MSFISDSNYSLLICRKAIDFCIRTFIQQPCYNILVSGVLLLLFILLLFLFLILSKFSYIDSHVIYEQREFYLFLLQNCMPFISFPCLIELCRVSHTMMNRNSKEEYPVFSHFRERHLVLHQSIWCQQLFFYPVEKVLSFLVCRKLFIINWYSSLSHFSVVINIIMIFFLGLLMWFFQISKSSSYLE